MDGRQTDRQTDRQIDNLCSLTPVPLAMKFLPP